MPARHHYSSTVIRTGLFKGLTSFSELEQRISSLPSNKERGDAFEVFAEAYLTTQKIAQAAEVWPEQHIPIEVLKQHKLPERDLGADGVYRTFSDKLNAYQVKFRTGRPALTWDELGTFMGLTDQVDERVQRMTVSFAVRPLEIILQASRPWPIYRLARARYSNSPSRAPAHLRVPLPKYRIEESYYVRTGQKSIDYAALR